MENTKNFEILKKYGFTEELEKRISNLTENPFIAEELALKFVEFKENNPIIIKKKKKKKSKNIENVKLDDDKEKIDQIELENIKDEKKLGNNAKEKISIKNNNTTGKKINKEEEKMNSEKIELLVKEKINKIIIIIRDDLKMKKGKIGAQVAHGSKLKSVRNLFKLQKKKF